MEAGDKNKFALEFGDDFDTAAKNVSLHTFVCKQMNTKQKSNERLGIWYDFSNIFLFSSFSLQVSANNRQQFNVTVKNIFSDIFPLHFCWVCMNNELGIWMENIRS